MARTVSFHLIQGIPERYEKEKNAAYMIEQIASSDADFVIFPEMYLTGYQCGERFTDLAEGADGPTVRRIADAAKAHGKYVIFGMPELNPGGGKVFNSAAIAHPDGMVETYHKQYLPHFGVFEEKSWFTMGSTPKLVETRFGTIGIIICYEIFFPELTKELVMAGADIIICISASPLASQPFFETLMVARAVENTAFFVYTNLGGPDGDVHFFGGSAVTGPRGAIMAKAQHGTADAITATIDLDYLAEARALRPVIADTREKNKRKSGV